jgi:hypothetical protein
MTPIGSSASGHALALQPDAELVLAGYSSVAATHEFALTRYTADGSQAGEFIVTTPIGANGSVADALALEPDGKIVAGGYTETGSNNTAGEQFALARTMTSTLTISGRIARIVTSNPSGSTAAGHSARWPSRSPWWRPQRARSCRWVPGPAAREPAPAVETSSDRSDHRSLFARARRAGDVDRARGRARSPPARPGSAAAPPAPTPTRTGRPSHCLPGRQVVPFLGAGRGPAWAPATAAWQ